MRISIGPKSLEYLQLPNVVVENHKGIPMTWLQNVTEWLGVLAEVNGRGKDENNFREECKAKLVPTVEQSSHTPTPFLSKASPKSCILLRGFRRHEITSKKNTKNWRKKRERKMRLTDATLRLWVQVTLPIQKRKYFFSLPRRIA